MNISIKAITIVAWLVPVCYFVIAVWLTSIIRKLKAYTSEDISSNDSGIDQLVDLMNSKKINICKKIIVVLSFTFIAVVNIKSSNFNMSVLHILLIDFLLSVILFYIYRVITKEKDNIPPGLMNIAKIAIKLSIVFGWVFTVQIITFVFSGGEPETLKVELSTPRMDFLGFNISKLVVSTWIVMFVLIVAAVLIRLFVIPKFTEKPGKFQNVLEIIVEFTSKYTVEKTGHDLGMNLGAYVFSIAFLMVGCASLEFFSIRAPTSDLTMTFSLAIITFILMNYYSIKLKGFGGRIKAMASPTPMIFPIKLVSDSAVPFSLACRLFGNMLGGMIVMELLHNALGRASVGIQSIFGLYFNVFHPLIQIFIFITLTLTFINEAVE